MKKKVAIPGKVRKAVLSHNGNMCCVCHARGVGVDIHHLDKDPSNNSLSNLAVLCVTDHDAHHRPTAYTRINHLNMSKAKISKAKQLWEWFIAETKKRRPQIVATITAYGNKAHVHAMRVIYQSKDQTNYLDRIFHELYGHPETWLDEMFAELCSFHGDIPVVLVNAPLPVEYCPCCKGSLPRTVIPAQFAKIIAKIGKQTTLKNSQPG